MASSPTSSKEPPGVIEKTVTALFTGGTASALAKTCVAPFERVRLILQTQSLIQGHEKQYKGPIDALKRVTKEQGFFSLWKGNVANILRIVPTYALRFTFLDIFQRTFKKSETDLTLLEQMASGGFSGLVTVLVTYPLDLARTRMSASQSSNNSLVNVLRTVVREEGPRGLYRGLFISVIEISPYLAITLGGFEYFKRKIPEEHNTPITKLLVGWSVGVVGSLVCFPIDTVKRRVMLDGTIGFKQSEAAEAVTIAITKEKGSGSIKTLRGQNTHTAASPVPIGEPRPLRRAARSTLVYVKEMYNIGGIRTFYRGCGLNALKSAPGAALTFVANDYLKALVDDYRK